MPEAGVYRRRNTTRANRRGGGPVGLWSRFVTPKGSMGEQPEPGAADATGGFSMQRVEKVLDVLTLSICKKGKGLGGRGEVPLPF